MWAVRAAVVSVLLPVLVVLAAAPASACSCAQVSADQILADADYAFVGRVVEEDVRSSDQNTVQTFAVERVAKGDVGPTFRLVAQIGPWGANSCAVLFPHDKRVGVTVFRSATGSYSTSGCSQIDPDALLELADGGRPPSATGASGVPAVPETVLGLPPWVAALGLGVFFVVAVALIVVARRRQDLDDSTISDP
jgi:hypothetical protein